MGIRPVITRHGCHRPPWHGAYRERNLHWACNRRTRLPPELAITRWFNTADNPTLADLRGEVVVINAFQSAQGRSSRYQPVPKRTFDVGF